MSSEQWLLMDADFLETHLPSYTANVQAGKNRLQGLGCLHGDIPIFGVVRREIVGGLFKCHF